MTGDFSLWKYFKTYCEIKNNLDVEQNLEQFGKFGEFEFVIYTNAEIENMRSLQGGHSDPLSILSSGTDCGGYISFDKDRDEDIFEFFQGLKGYHKLIRVLESHLELRASGVEIVNQTIKELQKSFNKNKILNKLKSMQKTGNTDCVQTWVTEEAKCDIDLFEEFLSKIKIFHGQSNVNSFKGLTEKELQEACKASPSVANCIYTKFEEGFSKWWKRDGNVEWLSGNSGLWQSVQNYIINEIKEISGPEIQENFRCGIGLNEQHVQELLDNIKQKTILNLVKKSTTDYILQKMKTYQALNTSGYKNPLFINIKSLILPRKEFRNFWPCKWSEVLVLDCGSDGNFAQRVEDILKKSADFGQGLDISDGNKAEPLINVLQKNQQKVILISHK